jgi:hypothetical protein
VSCLAPSVGIHRRIASRAHAGRAVREKSGDAQNSASAADAWLGVLDIRDAFEVLFEQEEYQEGLLVNYVAGVGYQ